MDTGNQAKRKEAASLFDTDELRRAYEVEDELGSGGFGLVYKVRDRASGRHYAVKLARAERGVAPESLLREFAVCVDLPGHPHMLGFDFLRPAAGGVALFAEYVERGSLERWIGQDAFSRLDGILDAAIQMAWGLEAAHSLGIVHQDFKLANVLLMAGGVVRVADFGLASARWTVPAEGEGKDLQEGGVSFLGGTRWCLSPEQAAWRRWRRGGPATTPPLLTPKTDMWSWAIAVLQMFGVPIRAHGEEAGAALEEYVAGGG